MLDRLGMEAVLNRAGMNHPLGMEDFEGDLNLGMANHREALQDGCREKYALQLPHRPRVLLASLRRCSAAARRIGHHKPSGALAL